MVVGSTAVGPYQLYASPFLSSTLLLRGHNPPALAPAAAAAFLVGPFLLRHNKWRHRTPDRLQARVDVTDDPLSVYRRPDCSSLFTSHVVALPQSEHTGAAGHQHQDPSSHTHLRPLPINSRCCCRAAAAAGRQTLSRRPAAVPARGGPPLCRRGIRGPENAATSAGGLCLAPVHPDHRCW